MGVAGALLRRHFYYADGQLLMAGAEPVAVAACCAYCAAVWYIRHMGPAGKPAMRAFTVAVRLWDLALAAFTAVALARLVPELLGKLLRLGSLGCICESAGYFDGTSGYWCFAFTLSRYVTPVDTLLVQFAGPRAASKSHVFYRAVCMVYYPVIYAHDVAPLRWIVAATLYSELATLGYFTYRWYTAKHKDECKTVEERASVRQPEAAGRLVCKVQVSANALCCLVVLAAATARIVQRGDRCDAGWPAIAASALVHGAFLVVGLLQYRSRFSEPDKRRRLMCSEERRREAVAQRSFVRHSRSCARLAAMERDEPVAAPSHDYYYYR